MASLRLRDCRWASAHVGQRVWLRIAGSLQFRHLPSSLAFSLCSWARFRWYSLRFSDWFLRRSCSSRFSLLASVSAGVGSGRSAGFPAFWVDLLVFFRCGLRDGFCLALVERLPALSGLGRSKVYSKVWPIAHPCGASYVVTSRRPVILGKPPSPRGIFSLSPLRTPALWSTPATAGPAWLATPPLTGAPRRGAQPRGEGVHRVWRRVRSEGVALIVSPLGRGQTSPVRPAPCLPPRTALGSCGPSAPTWSPTTTRGSTYSRWAWPRWQRDLPTGSPSAGCWVSSIRLRVARDWVQKMSIHIAFIIPCIMVPFNSGGLCCARSAPHSRRNTC